MVERLFCCGVIIRGGGEKNAKNVGLPEGELLFQLASDQLVAQLRRRSVPRERGSKPYGSNGQHEV